jgi:hypothetical protein
MAERGRDAPEGFYDRPEIEPHLAWLWNAFWELSTERQLGMTIGPIPGSQIREYLRDEMELTGVDYDRARSIIRKADDAYVGMLNRRRQDGPVMNSAGERRGRLRAVGEKGSLARGRMEAPDDEA